MTTQNALTQLRAKHPRPHDWRRLGQTAFEFRLKPVPAHGAMAVMEQWRPCRPPADVLAPFADEVGDTLAELALLAALEAAYA